MQRCIALAQNGLGTTYPNPLVGSVIVHNKKIIGEGWHYKAGGPHAEVGAIQSVKDHSLLPEATLYVNLEPCSHFGKTPPCSHLIIEKGIKNVVIGTVDPNPQVAGNGIQKLEAAGCKVITGVLQEACDYLNRRFFTFHRKNRPYIILKWAETKDGFIAPRIRDKQAPVWITNALSRQYAHKLRAEEAAILVGTQTVLDDNPSLTLRDWEGITPIRIVFDRKDIIPSSASIFNKDAPTIVLTETMRPSSNGLRFEEIDFKAHVLPQLFKICQTYKLQSVLIEGGTKTLQHFIDQKLWDEAYRFIGNTVFHEGIPAPTLPKTNYSKSNLEEDTLLHYKNYHS